MSSLVSIVPRCTSTTAATVVLGAMCLMSGVLPQPPCAYAQSTDETQVVTEEPESTQVFLPETPVPTVPLTPGRYVKTVVKADNAIIPGNFTVFFEEPNLKDSLKKSLEEDFKRGLEGRSENHSKGRRQENDAEAVVTSTTTWDVVVSNLRMINGNTELAFDVEATQTRLAAAEEEVVSAPPQALEDFNEHFDFSKEEENAPMASLDELYTKTTGTSPRDSFTISRATVEQTVVAADVLIVTEAPEEGVVVSGSSVSTASIVVPSVLGGVCLSVLCVLAAIGIVKHRQSGQGQTVKAESSQNEPYGENEEQAKEKVNPLGKGENDVAFSPPEASGPNPFVTESY